MKKNRKKLPKFWLGTRMPTSLGYQPNYGIGGYLYTSTPGESVLPETNTIKNNIIPSTLNKAQTYGSTLASMWLNTTPILTNASRQAMGNYLRNSFNEAINTSIASGGTVTEGTISSAAPKMNYTTGLNAAGKALGVVGAAYGLTDMGFLIANNQDHRTAGDMRNTLTTNTYTTDLGNKYTTHGGVDISSELDYARKQKLSKNLNFTTTAIGTGATIGSLFSPIGTAVGAGVGALVGLGANALGFGDTEEETKAAANRLTDVTSMEDKMSYSLAMNRDTQQGFYGRTKSGSLGAKDGKRPIYARNGKGNAMVSHGEVIGNLNEGWAYREPGIPDNNDTLKRHIKADDFVISNKYGLSDYAAATGDYVGALKAQDILMSDKYMMNGRNTDLLFLAKCGKLPKYDKGTPMQTIMASVPRIGGLIQLKEYENALKHADKSTPVEELSDYGANDAAYLMMGNLPDPRIYLNRSDRNYRNALYNIQRNPGLGHGGRAIAAANAYVQKQALDAETLSNIDEIRRQLINEALKLKYSEAQRMSNLKHESWWRSREDRNKIMSTYNNLMAQLPVNRYIVGSDLAGDLASIYQYGQAMDRQDDLNNIYRSSANAQEIAAYANLWDALNNGNKNTTSKVVTPIEYTKVPQLPEDIYKQYPWLLNDPNFMRFLQLNSKGK